CREPIRVCAALQEEGALHRDRPATCHRRRDPIRRCATPRANRYRAAPDCQTPDTSLRGNTKAPLSCRRASCCHRETESSWKSCQEPKRVPLRREPTLKSASFYLRPECKWGGSG